jgi:hypothetical protein
MVIPVRSIFGGLADLSPLADQCYWHSSFLTHATLIALKNSMCVLVEFCLAHRARPVRVIWSFGMSFCGLLGKLPVGTTRRTLYTLKLLALW